MRTIQLLSIIYLRTLNVLYRIFFNIPVCISQANVSTQFVLGSNFLLVERFLKLEHGVYATLQQYSSHKIKNYTALEIALISKPSWQISF